MRQLGAMILQSLSQGDVGDVTYHGNTWVSSDRWTVFTIQNHCWPLACLGLLCTARLPPPAAASRHAERTDDIKTDVAVSVAPRRAAS